MWPEPANDFEDTPEPSGELLGMLARHVDLTCDETPDRSLCALGLDPDVARLAPELVECSTRSGRLRRIDLSVTHGKYERVARALGPAFPIGTLPATQAICVRHGLDAVFYRMGFSSDTMLPSGMFGVHLQLDTVFKPRDDQWKIRSIGMPVDLHDRTPLPARMRQVVASMMHAVITAGAQSYSASIQGSLAMKLRNLDYAGKTLLSAATARAQRANVFTALGVSSKDFDSWYIPQLDGRALGMVGAMPKALIDLARPALSLDPDTPLETSEQFVRAIFDTVEKENLAQIYSAELFNREYRVDPADWAAAVPALRREFALRAQSSKQVRHAGGRAAPRVVVSR